MDSLSTMWNVSIVNRNLGQGCLCYFKDMVIMQSHMTLQYYNYHL